MIPADDTNILDPLHRHAVARPERAAVITPQGQLSWAQLDALVWSSAVTLHEAGIRACDRVGITMLHPLAHLAASLGLARIGAAQVALPVADAALEGSGIRQSLGLKTVLCDSKELLAQIPGSLLLERIGRRQVHAADRAALAAGDPSSTWLILQSSGTTGAPKFAELSHRDALRRFLRYLPLFDCTVDDVFWAASRLDFVVAKQRTMHSLLAGATVCLPVGMSMSRALVDFLNQTGVSLACGTPSHLHQLIGIGEPIRSMRAFEVRSAMIDEKLRKSFKATVSPNLHVVYATNEGEALTLADPGLQQQIPNTVGRPTASIELEIVDEQGRPVPQGQTGEIRVRGPGVVRSYLDNPDASARSFRDGWFHPGDLGYLTPEGALMLQGRKDDMMIFDGMNIYPAEIENALCSHPAIREAAAFPLKHERFQDVPVAAVTLHREVPENELIEHCRKAIGIRHPRRVYVVQEFPRNPMGKILKRELVSLAARAG